jgi:RecA/RadA recombinase
MPKSSRKPVKEKIISTVPIHKTEDLIPIGSTMFNLACSNNAFGAFKKGKLANLIGDSHAGKSILAMTMLAMCANMSRFDDYKLIYDDIEEADDFDHEYMFGKNFDKRVEAPKYIEGQPDFSGNIEDWQDNIHTFLEQKTPFIYVTDSFDALHSEEDEKKAVEQYNDRKKGKETKGTFGTAKAKSASFALRRIRKKLKHTNSFILIVSQTRDNINAVSFAPKTRSGGKALKFYSSHETWGAVVKSLDKTVDGIKDIIGTNTRWKFTKNKLTGRNRIVDFPIYNDIGIDDITSCLDFLKKFKVLTGDGKKTKLPLGKKDIIGTKDKIIKTIEEDNLERKLAKLCQETWIEHEQRLRLKGRKRRF